MRAAGKAARLGRFTRVADAVAAAPRRRTCVQQNAQRQARALRGSPPGGKTHQQPSRQPVPSTVHGPASHPEVH